MELKILRSTGETSRTTTNAGNCSLQKDWVSLRLLEQQADVSHVGSGGDERRKLGFYTGHGRVYRVHEGIGWIILLIGKL